MSAIYWNSAQELAQGKTFNRLGSPRSIAGLPAYYLASHAFELLLKSTLLKRGWQDNDLKKLDVRHNLNSLLEKLLQYDVYISEDAIETINRLVYPGSGIIRDSGR